MKVLVVGAGAVGQVYGRHAQLGGAEVTFFVREKYREACARGFDVYPLNRRRAGARPRLPLVRSWRRRRGVPVRFEGFGVVSRADEVRAERFNQVYLTVSSDALRGPWLAELIAAIGDATLVSLQPGQDDRDVLLAAGASEERLVSGMISLISYHAPLPGETRFPRPGMAYWFPPLGPSPFSGPAARTAAVVALLRNGGQPAKRHRDVPKAVAFPSAVMMPYLVALEAAGWSFRALSRDGMARGAQAAREALAVVALSNGKAPLGVRLIARPWVLRIGLWFARWVVPLPLETYLQTHFTKVGEQTRMFMDGYVARATAAGLAVPALEALRTAVAA